MGSELRDVLDGSFDDRERGNGDPSISIHEPYRLMEGEGDLSTAGRGDEEDADSESDWSDEPERAQRSRGTTLLRLETLLVPKETRMCVNRW